MQVINSKIDSSPIAVVYVGSHVTEERESFSDASQILQSSCKNLDTGREFSPHVHLPTPRGTTGTSEAWVIVSGSVEASLYDLDDSHLVDVSLGSGDCIVTFRGGHRMRVLCPTLLYEFKNGPYFGQQMDKRWL